MTFLEHLLRWLKQPEPAGRTAALSLQGVEELARQMAAGLGTAAGKHVVLIGGSSPSLLEAWCSLVRLGALPLVLPPDIHQRDLMHLLQDVKPAALVLENAPLLARVLSLPAHLRARTLVLEGLEVSDDEMVVSRSELEEVAEEVVQALGRAPAFGEPSEDTALLLYASAGSTGPPRLHSLTHHEALEQAIMVADRLRISAEDRVLSMGPWCHLPTLLFKVLIPVVQDLQVLLCPPDLTLSQAAKQLSPTVIYAPASIYRAFFKQAMETLEGSALVRGMGKWAVDVGLESDRQRRQGEGMSPWQQAKSRVAEAVYYRRCRELLSDDVRAMVYSDEGLHPQARNWFTALGLPLSAGYYLAEAGGFLSLEAPGGAQGAGLPLPGRRVSLTEGGFLAVGETGDLTTTDDLGTVEEGGHVRVMGHPPPVLLEGHTALDLHRALQLVQLNALVLEAHWDPAAQAATLVLIPTPLAREMASKLSAAEAHALVEEAIREELEESGLPKDLCQKLGLAVAWQTPRAPVALTHKPTCRTGAAHEDTP